MKTSKLKEELKNLGAQELAQKVDSLRRELFSIKLNASTAHVKDYSQFKKLRRNIARAQTFLSEKV